MMPTFKTPGVFIEDIRLAARTIKRADTSTTAFIGMTAWGPTEGDAPLLTSVADYRRIYGPDTDLQLGTGAIANHMASAAKAYFDNGGQRLHVVRVTGPGAKAANWATADGSIALIARTPGGAMVASGDSNIRATFATVRTPLTKAQALAQPIGTLIELPGGSCVIEAANPALAPLPEIATVTRVSLRITIEVPGNLIRTYDDLGLDARLPHAVQTLFGADDPTGDTFVRCVIDAAMSAAGLRDALQAAGSVLLAGGSDGDVPPAPEDWTAGMNRLRTLDDVSILAAPGSSALPGDTAKTVAAALIALVDAPDASRFAVLDPPPALTPSAVLQFAQPFDTKNAALYYPWIVPVDPAGHAMPALPPSGFVCGSYARNDIQRGVWTSPANMTVQGALDVASPVNLAQQAFLNPKGINCIRPMPMRGIRIFGARTLSTDSESKYVAQRRYLLHLERSISRGLAWAVFEPNGPPLWSALTASVTAFLMLEWRNGALLGAKPSEAFFVRCDRTTMTQDDIDNGRLVILIGIASLKPAEFVIFRIGSATAAK